MVMHGKMTGSDASPAQQQTFSTIGQHNSYTTQTHLGNNLWKHGKIDSFAEK